MELDVARVILAEVQRGGWLEGDLPENDAAIIEEAEYFLFEARKIWDEGVRDEGVEAIIRLGEGDAHPMVHEPVAADQPLVIEPEPKVVVHHDEVEVPVGLALRHNLPTPKDYDDTPEDFPRDISELTDRNVRRLSGVYNSYLSRAKYLLALSVADLANSTHLRDHAYRVALKATPKKDGEKSKLKEVLDAEVREDPEFDKYDTLVRGHQNDVTTLKALVDIYSGNVDRLSREWTMRQDEYEKTR